MPSKTTKGANKTHNRTSSASSTGKLSHTVAFTRNKSAEKIKRNASDIHVAPLSPPPSKRTPVVHVEIGGDDDEWVSSESGAATPADYDEEDGPPGEESDAEVVPSTTPRGDPPRAFPDPPRAPPNPQRARPDPPSALPPPPDPPRTLPPPPDPPRALPPPPDPPRTLPPPPDPPRTLPPPPDPDPAPVPLAPTRRPRPQSLADLPRVDTLHKFTTVHPEDAQSPDSLVSHHSHSHSHPRHRRPPSVQSARPRPHPLIRARSYAPSPATPTLGLTADPAQVLASASTGPSPTSSPRHHSTHYVHTPLASSPSPASDHYFHPRLKRQSSHSSVTSVATLPLPRTSSATARTTHVHGERHRDRALSAALSSLAAATHPHPHAPSRPPSPPFASAFPPVNPREEQRHVMIPPPLVPPHASATAHRNPILEALQRVAEARQRAGR